MVCELKVYVKLNLEFSLVLWNTFVRKNKGHVHSRLLDAMSHFFGVLGGKKNR